MSPILHGYWRSTAAYRVRIALNLKGAAYEQVTYDLRQDAQRGTGYLNMAPQGLVPALETEDGVLTQSLAILEWIEERWPRPPLLPRDRFERAIVRGMAALIAADVHPLNNLRVVQYLKGEFLATQAQVDAWMARWMQDGFTALDRLIAVHGGQFALGDAPSIADCLIVPQIYAAERFHIDLGPFPHLRRVALSAGGLAAFKAAHPGLQPDADPA
jgi:maleylpyruvate isomerase